jgi:hypothetical protein
MPADNFPTMAFFVRYVADGAFPWGFEARRIVAKITLTRGE